MGKVARLPGAALPLELMPRRKRRSRRTSGHQTKKTTGHNRTVLIAWSAVMFAGALVVLFLFGWFWLKPNMDKNFATPEQLAHHSLKQIVSAFKSPPEGVALKLVEKALAVREASEVESYFRVGSAQPDEVIDFLKNMESVDGVVTDFRWLSSMDANGMLIDGVLVNMTKDGDQHNRLALMTPNEDGVWQIDFEAFARIVKPSWDEVLSENSIESSVVRVLLAKDSYYNGPFMDDKIWECYGMISPDQEEILLGYCRKDSPQSMAMERLFTEDQAGAQQKVVRATLELARQEGAEKRQFEIKRVLAEDWVLSDKHFDAAFE